LQRDTSPFAGDNAAGRWGRAGSGRECWVQPTLVAEVRFAQWTPAGHIRHAAFLALRSDKPARDITREPVMGDGAPPRLDAPASATPPRTSRTSPMKVTHVERVVDEASGVTKLDLLRYYDSVAEFMLPHLHRRPVALVRGPGGVGAPLFFQKHDGKTAIAGVRQLDPALWPGHEALLEVPTREALLASAQMNVIEFHTWNATDAHLGKPDRMIFDLDPGAGVGWEAVQEAAVLTRALLTELGLTSWLKTSGGKGLHVVVPLAPRRDFDTVKGFSKAVVDHLTATLPTRFVAKSGSDNRVGRIFVDYLRNGEGATTVTAFSARARPGLGVSMPLAWDALDDIKSGAHWHVGNARDALSLQTVDPWAAMAGTKQLLTPAMKTLGFKIPVTHRRD
jgi:bifunctional non-homologous end joining protein LigD